MNHAPLFIREMISRGEVSGSFSGAVLLADIIGFTSRFDSMTDLGAEGAELVSREVSKTLSIVVETCVELGGFPVSFAGDAVTLVFPDGLENAQSACHRLNALNLESILPLKSSVGVGTVIWDAIPMDGWTFYNFQGSAVRNAAFASSDCSVEQPALASVDNESIFVSTKGSPVDCFNPPDLFSGSLVNEFRRVINIFISLENRAGSNCPRSFQEFVLQVAGELGGFVSGLETGSDDYRILVVFGAPISREDDSRRADNFLRRVFAEANGRVKAGTASGLVFSGLLSTPLLESYTVLGPSVNLAARLHSYAGWNSVYSDPVFNNLSRLGIRSEKEISLKGFSSPVKAIALSPWKKRVASLDPVPPLIEREELLHQIESELEKIDAQILLTGVTGIGKTRLATELSRRMGNGFAIPIRCESSSGGGSDIFSRLFGEWIGVNTGKGGLTAFRGRLYGFIDMLDELDSPAAVEVSGELLRAESVLAAMAGFHWERSLYQGLDPRGRFQNTVSVTAALIRGHSLLKRTVLFFDDLQWMDQDSVVLLAAVLAELGENRPPVVLLARPGLKDTIRDLGLTPFEIALSPLSREGCRSFLEWSLNREPSERLLDWFHKRTEGIPFFMEQYAMLLTSADDLPDEDEFPGNLHALLVARLDRLGSNLKETVLAASVLGRIFDPDILRRIMPDDDLKETLPDGVVERVWERAGDGMFSFIHVLLREAAYNLQLHSERRRLHAKAAEEMKKQWALLPEKAQRIAYHLEEADQFEDAAVWFYKAGKYSFSRNLITACHEQMQKVLLLSPDVSMRLDAHRMILDLYSFSGAWDEAEEAIRVAAIEELTAMQQARIKMMQVNLATNLGKPKEAAELLDGIEEANPGLRPQILNHRGRILMLQARTEEAMHLLLDVHRELKNGTPEEKLIGIKALGNASGCMLRLGMRAEAEKPLKQVLAYAVETGNLVMEALAVGNLALVYKYQPGRHNDAVRMTRRHLELARKTGSRLLELQAVGNLGTLLEREASNSEVFELLERAVELSRKYGGNESLSISLANLGRGLQKVGRLEQSLESFQAALGICSKEGMSIHQLDYAFETAHVLMDLGMLDQAQEQIRQIDRWQTPEDYLYSILWCECRLLRLQNRKEEAAAKLRAGLEKFEEDWGKFDLLHELYLSTGDRIVLDQCIQQGETLYIEEPQWDLREKIDKLQML